MYEFLKMLLPVVEEIFNIRDIKMEENNPYWGDRITINGVDSENRSCDLSLTIEKHENRGEE